MGYAVGPAVRLEFAEMVGKLETDDSKAKLESEADADVCVASSLVVLVADDTPVLTGAVTNGTEMPTVGPGRLEFAVFVTPKDGLGGKAVGYRPPVSVACPSDPQSQGPVPMWKCVLLQCVFQ